MTQGEISKKRFIEKYFNVIKHAKFEYYKTDPAGVNWKNRQLTTNIYTNEFHLLYIKRCVSAK